MIASLSGTVQAVSTGSVIIAVSGVGFEVLATPDTLARLQVGSEAFLHTALVVKEDSLTLFGFAQAEEKSVFNILLTVSGIGARTALTILSVLPPNELRAAIANKNEGALTRVPGIGKKSAQRLILEIGTKLGPALAGAGSTGASVAAGSDAGASSGGAVQDADVLTALVNLGWPERLADEAIKQAHTAAAEQGTSLSVPELLRNALRVLGSRR